MSGEPTGLEARLGLLDATALVAGSMIGSGIFIVSADIARRLPAPGWLLVVWMLAGLLTVAGAVSYGALAAAMPRAGGQYAYLAELYGPLAGFLYGWTLVLVIQTGTIAAVAVGFARYLGVLVPAISPTSWIIRPIDISRSYAISLSTQQLVGILSLVLLTYLNTRSAAARRARPTWRAPRLRPASASPGRRCSSGRRWSVHSSPRMRGPTSPSPPVRCAMRAGPSPARWCSAPRSSACST